MLARGMRRNELSGAVHVGYTRVQMPAERNKPVESAFNPNVELPYELRIDDFKIAMQDVYDFFFDVNKYLMDKGLERLDDMLRPANLSGTLSDMLTASVAKHSRVLTVNNYHNGHPDLIVRGRYPADSVKAGDDGVEIKTTRKPGGGVDMHGARDQWLCVFVYEVDNETEPAIERKALAFTEAYIGKVNVGDFRTNERGALGTRTSSLNRAGMATFRQNWIYKLKR
jgi:hypothetical protein